MLMVTIPDTNGRTEPGTISIQGLGFAVVVGVVGAIVVVLDVDVVVVGVGVVVVVGAGVGGGVGGTRAHGLVPASYKQDGWT